LGKERGLRKRTTEELLVFNLGRPKEEFEEPGNGWGKLFVTSKVNWTPS